VANFNGLKVLLVRPVQPDARCKDSLVSLLIRHGAVPRHLPVMKIIPCNEPSKENLINGHLLDYTSYSRVIFTSRPAVFFLFEWLKNNIENFPDGLPDGPKYYAVGKTTAGVLKKFNIDAEYPQEEFSSEKLLQSPSLQEANGEKLLIFSGVGGRQLLSDKLHSRGFLVKQCELYDRTLLNYFSNEINNLIGSNKIDIVIVHSGEMLKNLVSQVSSAELISLKRLPLLTPSKRVSLLAKKLGFQNTIYSSLASSEHMVSILREWYSNR